MRELDPHFRYSGCAEACGRCNGLAHAGERSAVPCGDLATRFIELAYCPTSHPESWQQVWQLLVRHAWYRHQLDTRARWLLAARGLSMVWLEDVKHDALLLLARNLRRAPHLHAVPHRPPHEFAFWMRAVITRDLQEAIRRIRRLMASECHESLEGCSAVARSSLEERLDLQLLIGQLDPRRRGIVQLHLQGHSHREIAASLGMPLRCVRRTFRRAIRTMQIAVDRMSHSRPKQRFQISGRDSCPSFTSQYR